MNDPFDLNRFIAAQENSYESALAELSAGQKRTHWMWYIFPQIAGLGRSATAQRYAISGLEEARAYLAHQVLGERLRECCDQLLALDEASAHDIFGSPDDMKLRSSMTLFSAVDGQPSIFFQVLQKYYQGQMDTATLEIIGGK